MSRQDDVERCAETTGAHSETRNLRDVALAVSSLAAIPAVLVSLGIVVYRFFPVPWDVLIWVFGDR